MVTSSHVYVACIDDAGMIRDLASRAKEPSGTYSPRLELNSLLESSRQRGLGDPYSPALQTQMFGAHPDNTLASGRGAAPAGGGGGGIDFGSPKLPTGAPFSSRSTSRLASLKVGENGHHTLGSRSNSRDGVDDFLAENDALRSGLSDLSLKADGDQRSAPVGPGDTGGGANPPQSSYVNHPALASEAAKIMPFGDLPPIPPQTTRVMIMPDKQNWYYLDPQGVTQGPFTGLAMHEWYRAGYFQPSLMVLRENTSSFEPLSVLVRRIGNQREPFLVPMPSPTEVQSIQSAIKGGGGTSNNHTADGTSLGGRWEPREPPLSQSFPSYGTTLTAEQQNALESRKQEEQYMMVRQREMMMQQQYMAQQMSAQQRFGAHQPPSRTSSPFVFREQQHGETQSAMPPTDLQQQEVGQQVQQGDVEQMQTPEDEEKEGKEEMPSVSGSPKVNEASKATRQDEQAAVNTTDGLGQQNTEKRNEETLSEPARATEPFEEATRAVESSELTEAQTTPNKPAAVAPWANTTKSNSPMTLREIQEMDRKRAQALREEESRRAAQQRILDVRKAQAEALHSRASIVERTGSPWTPVEKPQVNKSLLDIQKEEAAARAKQQARAQQVENRYAQQARAAAGHLPHTAPVSLNQAKRSVLTLQAKPAAPSEIPAGWSTVGAGGKVKTTEPSRQPAPTGAATAATAKPVAPRSVATRTAPESARNGTVANGANDDLMMWCKSTLKEMNKGVNSKLCSPLLPTNSFAVDEFLQMLLSFPVDDPETKEIISDSVYANTATADGRRFANEFVKRRKALADAAHKASNSGNAQKNGAAGGSSSWSSVIKNSPTSPAPGWNEAFTVVSSKKKGRRN